MSKNNLPQSHDDKQGDLLLEIYYNKNSPKQTANAEMFRRIAKRFSWLEFTYPNKIKAPWHVQGFVPCAHGEAIILNFWPHKGKAQQENCTAVVGEEGIGRMIAQAIDDSTDEFEVLE